MPDLSDTETPNEPQPKRLKVLLLAVVAVAALTALILVVFLKLPQGPVPKDIQKQVGFRIYYPVQNKLPKGYMLDKNSFRIAQSNVVLFSIKYGNGRSMVFSEAAKPSGDVIDKFNASAIPVHTQVSTAIGKALVGAYGSGKDLRTIASLPINNGPWLIVTAPADINQSDLNQIIQSLRK